eukprot:1149959-Pelagomonas_calceolata.AAC.5
MQIFVEKLELRTLGDANQLELKKNLGGTDGAEDESLSDLKGPIEYLNVLHIGNTASDRAT